MPGAMLTLYPHLALRRLTDGETGAQGSKGELPEVTQRMNGTADIQTQVFVKPKLGPFVWSTLKSSLTRLVVTQAVLWRGKPGWKCSGSACQGSPWGLAFPYDFPSELYHLAGWGARGSHRPLEGGSEYVFPYFTEGQSAAQRGKVTSSTSHS